MPCPSCGELVVFFRKKVIGVNRKILEQGTLEERKMHLASVIAEFIEPGMFRLEWPAIKGVSDDFFDDAPVGDDDPEWLSPISDRDVENFTRIQLERLDDSKYFKKHFG